jgi:hypothetical protein
VWGGGRDKEVKEKDEVLNFRIFKTLDGKSFRANIVSKTSTVITVKLATGKEQQIPVANLSKEDQEFANSWTEAGDIFLRHCGALKIEELLNLRKYNSFQYERRGNHIFVDGTLNANKVTYMIDTGANTSLLDLVEAPEVDQQLDAQPCGARWRWHPVSSGSEVWTPAS